MGVARLPPVPDLEGAPAVGPPGLVARNVRALALSSVWSRGLVFVWQLALARWLGDEGYGVYGTIGALMVIAATLPEFGLGLIVVRDVARRPAAAGRYLTATLLVQLPLAVLAYVAALGAAWIAGYPASLRRLLSLAGVLLLVDALGNMGHNQLVARERMVICAGIAVAHATLLVALSALALGVGGGLAGLYLAAVLAGVARTIAYWIAAWRVGCRPAWPVDRALLRSLPAEGLPLAALAFLTLAAFHGDKLITTALLGTAATGQLTAAAVVVFGVVELFSTVPLVAVLPLMSRAHATGGEGLPGILARLGRLTLLVGLPLAAATSLLAAPLTATLFGGAFARTADVLRILIWAALAAMLANIGAQVLIVRGEQGRLLGARATGLVVGWGLTLALLPHLGVTGAAPAALAAEILVLLLLARACDLPRTWWAGLRGRAARLGAAGLTLGIVVVLLRGVHPVLALTAGLIAYAALVRLSGALAPGDWAHLRRLVRGRPAEDPIALERRPTGR